MNQALNQDAQGAPLTKKVKISEIDADTSKTLAVDAAECEAIKSHLDLLALENLDFTYSLRLGAGGRVHVSGRLKAEAVQTCVVTLEPVPAVIDVPVETEFWPASMIADLEKKAEDPSQAGLIDWPEAIEDEQIDLGPMVYGTLATSLEPYPRKTGASFHWSQGDLEEQMRENGPFAGLKRLKDS